MSWYSSPCYLAEFMLQEEQAAAERSSHNLIDDARPCVHRDEAAAPHHAASVASREVAAPQHGPAATGVLDSATKNGSRS
jgi:hypothetical protein